MAQVQPMDIDNIENDFDNKENSSHHSNVLPRNPCIEKGYEELDASELNMKLRYSITPASSPMSKSLNDCENNVNNFENCSLTRSLNFTINKPERVNSLKSLPLQVLPTDEVIKDRNSCILHMVEPSCNENNVTMSLDTAFDIDENISLPSMSTSAMTTPEATTPTKEIPKHDGSSPIMRGLKSVLNMFRTSQSPISLSESISANAVPQANLNRNDSILKDSENNRSQTVVVSTPISNKEKELCGSRRTSPLKESIIFNEDLKRNLQWKDETTIFFKHEKIPIHILFPPQPLPCNSKTSKDVAITSKTENNVSKNVTEEYMSMSDNGSISQMGNVISQLPSVQNEVSTLESDGEFVDCEMTINEEFYNSKLTEKEINTYEKLEHCSINKFNIEENMQEINYIEAVFKNSVLHHQCAVTSDVPFALKPNENISLNFEHFVNETSSVVVNNGDENETIISNTQNMKENKINTEHIISTNVTLCDDLKKCIVEVKENDDKIGPSQVSLPYENNVDLMEFSKSTKNIDELKIKSNVEKQDLNVTVMSIGKSECVTTEETCCQDINNKNEMKSLQVNDQEINNHTSQQSSIMLVRGQTATSLYSDMHKECLERQVIDAPVNVSFKSIRESPKKEYKPTSKVDNDEEKDTDKSTSGKLSDEDFTTIIPETDENNLEFKMKSFEKNNLKYINSTTAAETTNLNFLSNESIDNTRSQLHFRESYDLSKDPNHSTIKQVSQNKLSGMLTTTINEEKAHQVNDLNNKVRETNSEIVLDDLKENLEVRKQNAATKVDKNISKFKDQDGLSLDITEKCDEVDMDDIINLRGSNENLSRENLEGINEKSDKNVPIENNTSDKVTNFENAYFNQLNTCAADTTINIDINKEVGFESNPCIKTSFSTCERVKNIDKGENLEQNKGLKHTAKSDVHEDSSLKSEYSVFHTEHEEISTSEVITEDDRPHSKDVNISHCEDILKSVNKSEAMQLENSSGVNNSLDHNAAGNDGLIQLYFTHVTPPTAPYQDTLVDYNEVLACHKHCNSKYNTTKNEVRSQEKITTLSALQEKENDSIISINNSPKNVFNLPEISSVFVSKPKDNANASATLDAEDCPKHMFKVPSNDYAHYPQNSDSKTKDVDRNLCMDKNDLDSSDVSTSSKASEATVHEVNTEDEDTVEASFFEAEESNEADKKSEHEDMIDFSDIPARKINDNVYKGEMFIDAEAFQFLLNQNKSNVVADSGRESLFLKFDPLYAKRMSSDVATVNKIQKGQSTPKRISKTFSNIDFYRNANENKIINSTLETNFDDATVLLSKPMMVVNPAVNSVFSPRNKSLTPPRTNRRSYTFTSPAIAVIDRLLSLSGDNTALNHEMSLPDTRGRTNEADLALMQLRELLAEKEINVQGLRSESKELTERLRTLESQVKDLETESEQRFRRVDDLNKCLDEKTKMNKGMAVVVEEYERTIASLTAEIEQDKRAHAEERSKLTNERNEHNAHLASMTMSFNDLYSKYEKNKQIILNCKANEEKYKRSIEEFDASVLKIQNNYELLKQHATSNLNNKNEEFVKLNRSHEAEILKYGAMIKRKEMDISSLKETLTQKIKANEELTAICDELLNKVA